MENNISLLIGLKNNIEYTKFFYQHTRELYPDVEIVFVSYGSTDGTNIWLDNLEDSNVKYFYSEDNKTLSDTYNKATSIATKKYVCFLHNDMVLGKDFLENLSKSLDSDNIFCYKVVEPPIFDDDNRDWKIIKDFGDEFKTFKFSDFYQYEKEYLDGIVELKKITVHTSFFLSVQRETLLKIGGLDPPFSPMFCEDDDLILRLRLSGEKIFLCANAITYHFVSKTSRFSEEFSNKSLSIEKKSQRNFVRKWGFDCFIVPRINIVEGITDSDIRNWNWNVNEKDYVNFPDYQNRIFKLGKNIRWQNKIQEVLINFKKVKKLPSDNEDYCLFHIKNIDKQRNQNAFYDTL